MGCCFHVDLDAFYASVEQQDHPEFSGKPVIIGAKPGTRGVVSACSYEARKFGVHSAMPISQAYRKCPQGVYLPPRMERYSEMSKNVMGLLDSYSPEIQQISIDEAFINMTGTERLFGSPRTAALRLKTEIKTKTGLTISVGIAANKYLAKLASEYEKPDGLYEVAEGKEIIFLDKLSLGDLWGIGRKTLDRLSEYNIDSVQKLRQFKIGALKLMFGNAGGKYLFNAVRGIDPGIHHEEPKSRSLSSEFTFPKDSRDKDSIYKVLLDLSHQVMFRMMSEGFKSKTITVKLRFSDFTTTTIQKSLRHHVHSAEEIYHEAKRLLEKRWDRTAMIRLIGIGLSSLERAEDPEQPELFEDALDKQKKVEQAVLRIRSEHTSKAVVKASLLHKKKGDHNNSL